MAPMTFAVRVNNGTGAGVKRPKPEQRCHCGALLWVNRTTRTLECVRCEATNAA